METKFIFVFVNLIVIILLTVSLVILAKKGKKLSSVGLKIFFWEAVVALAYLFISYGYLNTVYSQPEYFWYGTYMLYPATLVMLLLFAFHILATTFERLGYDEKITSLFDEEEA